MSTYHVEISKIIPAAAETSYAVIADYEEGHPAILPEPYFTGMVVEQGGRGLAQWFW